jgi:molecular chaperone DnaJ
MSRDYYAVLEIGVGATPAQVKRAYQRLARRYSPDVNFWDRDTQALFEEIVEAYRVLSDPSARGVYDRHGGQGRSRPERANPKSASGGRRGDDAHVAVELSFVQAASGASADVTVERLGSCETCDGTGGRPHAPTSRCEHCAGAGTVWRREGTLTADRCPACGGIGERISEPCPDCHGRGLRPERTVVPVAIPAGVDSGAQIRVAGEGHAGPRGGPRGDLIVIARVQEDPAFTRKGDNLHVETHVTVAEAVLGARVPVRTLEGTAELVVPPGTQSGQVLRLRGRGLPRLTSPGRGDLFVTVRVEIPRGIDARTQELFRELGRLLPRQGVGS